MHPPVFAHEHDRELLARKEPPAAVEYLVEHRRGVGHGTANDLQDFRGGGLALERLLGFIEQPCVLDRDHGLARERLQEVDLLVGEPSDLGARHRDRAGDLVVPPHRDGENTSVARQLGNRLYLDVVLRVIFGKHVGDVHDRAVPHRARGGRCVAGPHREHLP